MASEEEILALAEEIMELRYRAISPKALLARFEEMVPYPTLGSCSSPTTRRTTSFAAPWHSSAYRVAPDNAPSSSSLFVRFGASLTESWLSTSPTTSSERLCRTRAWMKCWRMRLSLTSK